MGIWIRTQNREDLIKVERVVVTDNRLRGVTKTIGIHLRNIQNKRKSIRNPGRNTKQIN